MHTVTAAPILLADAAITTNVRAAAGVMPPPCTP